MFEFHPLGRQEEDHQLYHHDNQCVGVDIHNRGLRHDDDHYRSQGLDDDDGGGQGLELEQEPVLVERGGGSAQHVM